VLSENKCVLDCTFSHPSPSEIRCLVVRQKLKEVSKGCTASNFRVGGKKLKKIAFNNFSIVACIYVAAGFIQPLPSNERDKRFILPK
jgi:hypothetical protein